MKVNHLGAMSLAWHVALINLLSLLVAPLLVMVIRLRNMKANLEEPIVTFSMLMGAVFGPVLVDMPR